MHIKLQPVGKVDGNLISALREALETSIGFDVNTSAAVPVPDSAYLVERGQYLADNVLSVLLPLKKEDSYILGITDVNMFTPGTNFVFGLSDPSSGIAIISISLLRSQDSCDPCGEELLLQRALKEAIHELGHLLGMGHCPDGNCVMHFSGSLIDTDIKQSYFCTNCRPRLIL